MKRTIYVRTVFCTNRKCSTIYLALEDVLVAGNVCPNCKKRPIVSDLAAEPIEVSGGGPFSQAARMWLAAVQLGLDEAERRLVTPPKAPPLPFSTLGRQR